MSRRVVVVGGGVTGLATAWFLRHGTGPGDQLAGGAPDVTLLEASDRLGGKVVTTELDGATLDVGADAFLARRPEGEELVRRLGLGGDLVAPATGQVWLAVGGRLRPFPGGTVLGVPTDLRALARARVLSPAGLARAALEPLLPARPLGEDRAVGTLVARRYGREVADVLVDPLLGGVYAGRADELSVRATAPAVADAAASGRTLTSALRDLRARTAGDPGPVFLTVAGGLARVVDALTGGLDDVRTGAAAVALEPRDGGGADVVVAGGQRVSADHVVLTTPAFAAAPLVATVAPAAGRLLERLRYASVAVVALAYPGEVGDRWPAGSGMLVPRGEGRLVKAVTWSSQKWPHLAGGDRFLVRASVGRIDDDRALRLDDDELAQRVAAEVADAVGVDVRPTASRVVRWERALPQYEVGHLDWVRDVRDAVRVRAPWLELAGAAYDGVGLTPCVAGAAAVARRLTAAD